MQIFTSKKNRGRSPAGTQGSRRPCEQTQRAVADVFEAGGCSQIWSAMRGGGGDSGVGDLPEFSVNKTCRGMLVATIEEGPCIIHVE